MIASAPQIPHPITLEQKAGHETVTHVVHGVRKLEVLGVMLESRGSTDDAPTTAC